MSSIFKAMISKAVVNPLNGKARTLPLFNITDKYGKNFHLSWFGFFVAFFSWFAFPPLLAHTLKDDLNLTAADIANSNIVGLSSTLLVRVVTGSLCDRYGPRYVMAFLLLAGSIPTALAGVVQNATGLMVLRFFIGILGGTFVPCQVWMTAFFDKNIVGLANGLSGGWGNAGGGVVFFVMPSVVQALVTQHNMSLHVAWRVSFLIVPFALIVSTAIAILLFGDDCPQGKWENRHMNLKKNEKPSIVEISTIPEDVNTMAFIDRTAPNETSTDSLATLAVVTDDVSSGGGSAWSVVFSKETFLPGMLYLCSFGAEIAVEGMISGFFMKHSRLDGSNWTEAQAGGYASIFGLMNFVTRPLGGYIADLIYKHYSTVGKKWWVLSLVAMEGIAFIVIGCLPTLRVGGVVALMSVVALAMELGNGANYALVPHLNPSRNGLVSGMVGAFGNLGGIVFALVFRFSVTPFQGMWISGVVVLASVLSVCWVPVSKSK